MKEKFHKKNTTTEILKFITKTRKFKATILLSILLSLYGSFVLTAGIKNYFSAILNTFQFATFNSLFFLVILINTVNVCSTFNQYDSYLIRLENKKKYLKELIKLVVYSNLIVSLVILLSYLSVVNILKCGYIYIKSYNGYINNMVYTIFYLLRYIVLTLLVSIFNVFLYHKLKEEKVIVIDFIFVFAFWLYPLGIMETTNTFQLPIWRYFENIDYGNFMLEVSYSLLYILLLEVLVIFVYHLINRREKIFMKYIAISDIKYMIKKNYKYILTLILIPAFSLYFIISNYDISSEEMLITSMGLRIDSYFPIDIMMFIINIIIHIYLVISFYINDLIRKKDNLFLRISTTKWCFNKQIVLIFLLTMIKISQYIVLILMICLKTNSNFDFKSIINLFISDVLFTNVVQLVSLWILFNCKDGNFIRKRMILCFIIIFIILMPKNIIWYRHYLYGLLILTIILMIQLIKNIKLKRRNVTEMLGGKL